MMAQAAQLCAALMAINMPNAQYACSHAQVVVEAATQNDLDPFVLASLIHEESRWRPKAVSKAGACGLTQLLPRYTKPRHTCEELKDPEINIWMGATTLRRWINRYGKGKLKVGLCGYNAGYRCKGPKALRSGHRYARRIIRFADRLKLVSMQRKATKIITELQLRVLQSR